MTQPELLNLIRDRIVASFRPLRLVLFGSRARGDARPDSDVDLLVVMAAPTDKRRAAVAIRRVLRDIPVGKDILVTTPEELAARGAVVGDVLGLVLREGKVLFERG